jgi:hypothetical protein
MQNRNLMVWSYPGEGFRFSEPFFASFLFSFQNGTFIYTPLLLAVVFSAFLLLKNQEYRHVGILSLATFTVVVYVMSCWWIWHFDSIFGSRVLIEYFPILFIPMAFAIDRSKRGLQAIIGSFGVLCIVLNLIQTWQAEHTIFHPDAMNREKYFHVFLKTGSQWRFQLGGYNEPPKIGDRTALKSISSPDNNTIYVEGDEFTAFHSFACNQHAKWLYFELSLEKRSDSTLIDQEIFVVISTALQGELRSYQAFQMFEIAGESHQKWATNVFRWNHNMHRADRHPVAPDDIRVYVWNPQKQSFVMRNLQLKGWQIE